MNTTSVAVEGLADKVAGSRQKILSELRKVIVGQDDVVDEVLMALFCGGHCLITGVPGLAKTLLVKTLSQILDLSFKRIQFTPDLMPADITGTEILDEDHGSRALRFGQRIRAFELDRVLGGEHEERPFELIGAPGSRDGVFLHRLEQRRLRLRRRPVDLVGEDDLREDRPLHEAERAMPVLFVEHLGSRDVGRHQIRRELDALERQIEDLRHRLDQQGLGQPGHSGNQAVPSGEQGHQHFVDDGVLPDDDLPDLRENALTPRRHPLGDRRDIGGRRRRHVHQCVSE